MKRMTRQPTHPGTIIKDMASTLKVARKSLLKIINERGSITPGMALRLSRVFDTATSSAGW